MSPTSKHAGHLTHPKYRPDIDGLRAVAVLSVVGFHAFPKTVDSGFIGVDIFFVISGFLISSIIFSSLERDSFSFFEFYGRRVRRIFPALIVVLATCFALGWVALLADEYKQLGKHIAGGAGFVSNLVLWGESSYFDNASDTKPLLHLWSLGVEEQFYIVWPLLLWAVWKKRTNTLAIIAAIALVSFVLSASTYRDDSTANFYSPQTRFWELLAGSLLAYFTLHSPNLFLNARAKLEAWLARATGTGPGWVAGMSLRDIQSLLGGFMIAIGLAYVSKRHFPGVGALLPVLGAVLLISAGKQAILNRVVLSNPLLVWFGLISYPLYLWHWPLLSFARIVGSGTPEPAIRVAAVLMAIVLAWLTYRLVEKPLRFGGFGRQKAIALLGTMIVVGSIGFLAYKNDGLEFREVVALNPLANSGADGGNLGVLVNECGIASGADQRLIGTCSKDSRQEPRFALLGDSKAGAILDGLVRTSGENGRWLFIGGVGEHNAFLPVRSEAGLYTKYQPQTAIALEAVTNNKNIEKVVLVMATRALFRLGTKEHIKGLPRSKHYHTAFQGLSGTLDALTQANKQVVIVVDNPTLLDPKNCLQRVTSVGFVNDMLDTRLPPGCSITIDRHLSLSKQYRELLSSLELNYSGKVKVFDTLKYLCDTDRGICLPSKDGRLMYSYTDHISDYAAGLIGKDLNDFLMSY